MAKYKRMINCDFVNASSFKLKISNRAKLLYFFMLSSADDKGFVDNTDELVELLDSNDRKFKTESNEVLLPNTFETAIVELLERGLIIEFQDKHYNRIYLIKHWYLHNVIPRDRIRDSSYEKYLDDMTVNEDGEYEKRQMPNKCNTSAKQVSTQIKENKSKLNKSNNELNNNNNAHALEENEPSELEIPDIWGYEESSRALSIQIKEKHGLLITDAEKQYLNAYQKAVNK